MTILYVVQALEDRVDCSNAGRVSSRLCGGTLYAAQRRGKNEIEQLKENVYRVVYRTSVFTSQERLDRHLRRRCAELALREGYDFFQLAQRADMLGFSRRTAMTVTLYKGPRPLTIGNLYDAKDVLVETATIVKAH